MVAGVLAALLTGALAQTVKTALKPHPDAVPNTHAPGEVDRPELVPFIVADPTKLPGIVVDETAAVLVGKWQYSTHTPPYVGLGYLHDQSAGKGEKSATFTPDLPGAGRYEVRLAHCYNIRRATNAPVIAMSSVASAASRAPPSGARPASAARARYGNSVPARV